MFINNGSDEKTPLLTYGNTKKEKKVGYDKQKFLCESVSTIASAISDFDDDDNDAKDLDDSTASKKSLYRSITSQASLLTLVETLSNDRRSSLLMTIFNILLTLQGSAVFSMPYAVLSGGIPFIVASFMMCLFTDISSNLLVDCMYNVSPHSGKRKRTFGDLSEIANECWGRKGRVILNVVNVTYLFSNNVVNVVLLGRSFYDVLGEHIKLSQTEVVFAFSPLLIPALFIKRMSILAFTSAAGVTAILIATLTSLAIFFENYFSWHLNVDVLKHAPIENFPLAIGILMYSLIVNPILPQIEGSMKKPSQSASALHISYGFSSLIKLGFGIVAVLTFGLNTKQLVSLNISMLSVPAKFIISICLVTYALTNFALIFITLFDQLDNALNSYFSRTVTGFTYLIWSVTIRVSSVIICVIVAIYVPYFALVSGLVGAFIGTCFIFVFPICFHLQLKWTQLSYVRRIFEIILLTIGVSTGGLAVYSSSASLIRAIKLGS